MCHIVLVTKSKAMPKLTPTGPAKQNSFTTWHKESSLCKQEGNRKEQFGI